MGILFQFYNVDLLDIPNRYNEKDGVAFVDDTTYIAMANTMVEAAEKLKKMMEHENSAFAWANTHNCSFTVEKFALMGFMR